MYDENEDDFAAEFCDFCEFLTSAKLWSVDVGISAYENLVLFVLVLDNSQLRLIRMEIKIRACWLVYLEVKSQTSIPMS